MDEWLLRLIRMIVSAASPEIRKNLAEWLIKLEAEAKKTENKCDDILVMILKAMLNG